MKRVRLGIGATVCVSAISIGLALWLVFDIAPVTPDFLKEKPYPKAAKKKRKPIEIDDILKPAPPKAPAASDSARAVANLDQLQPRVSSALKGFGEGGGEFGGDFDENGGQGAKAGAAIEKAGIERLAKAIKKIDPHFPPFAREKNVSGFVVVEVQVSTSGQPVKIRVLESQPPGVFDASALEAMRSWVFEPAMNRGQPVASNVIQRVRFDLE